jgi:hypothetical protein
MANQQFHALQDKLLTLEIGILDSPDFLFVWLDLYFPMVFLLFYLEL